MSTTTHSQLRQRMIEDMRLRNLAPRTQEAYIRGCRKLAAFLRRSPDTATAEDIRLFQLQLAEQGVSICTRNRTMTGVVFLFRVTLRRPEIADQIQYVAEPQKIPLVLSPEEVRRRLDAAPGFKYRLLLSLAYGCGLRASEVVLLKVCDIDSAQMVIRIEQGKGRKDRYVMLSPDLLGMLRQWWTAARPQGWLFPGRPAINPLTTRQLNPACAHDRAGRWALAGRIEVDRVPTQLLPARTGFVPPIPPAVPRHLAAAHKAGQLKFFGDHAGLTDNAAFAAFLAPWAKAEWVVYAKEPFGGPEEVLRYLSRYTHRVAISNRRLVSADDTGVTFKCKDYRIDGPGRYTTGFAVKSP